MREAALPFAKRRGELIKGSAEGAILVGASDTQGMIADDDGLDVTALIALKAEDRPLREHRRGRKLAGDAVIDIPCDIWIPAARPDAIHAGNVARLRASLVAQGASIPCTPDAEAALAARGILVLPDFIANAGGVICAATEYRGGTEAVADQQRPDGEDGFRYAVPGSRALQRSVCLTHHRCLATSRSRTEYQITLGRP